jgi:hypothetical protein
MGELNLINPMYYETTPQFSLLPSVFVCYVMSRENPYIHCTPTPRHTELCCTHEEALRSISILPLLCTRALQKNNADVSPAVAKIIKIDGEKHRSSARGAPES